VDTHFILTVMSSIYAFKSLPLLFNFTPAQELFTEMVNQGGWKDVSYKRGGISWGDYLRGQCSIDDFKTKWGPKPPFMTHLVCTSGEVAKLCTLRETVDIYNAKYNSNITLPVCFANLTCS
jgi:hypothetical protein